MMGWGGSWYSKVGWMGGLGVRWVMVGWDGSRRGRVGHSCVGGPW